MSREDLNPTAASLLGFLLEGPKTGWDLDRAVAESIGNFWNVTRSQIYRELRVLTEQGYVAPGRSGPRDRVPYAVTDAGRRAFRAWISERPPPDIIRSRLLLTVFFGEHLDPARLRDILEEQRRAHVTQLERYERLAGAGATEAGFPGHTLGFGIAYERIMIEWLDDVLAQGPQLS